MVYERNRPGTGSTNDTLRRAAALTLGRSSFFVKDEDFLPPKCRNVAKEASIDAVARPAPLSARTPRKPIGQQLGSYRPPVPSIRTDGDVDDPDLAAMLHEIGTKCAQKFTKARQAFRFVDVNKDGRISREEIAQFFHIFNMPPERVNCFFDFMNKDGSAEIGTKDFVTYMWPYINPGCDEQAPVMLNHDAIEEEFDKEARQEGVFRHPPMPAVDLKTLPNDLMLLRARIIQKLSIKHKRRVLHFKSVCGDYNGDLTLRETRAFFESIGWPGDEVADRFFQVLDTSGIGLVPRAALVQLFDDDQDQKDVEHRRLLRTNWTT